MVSASRGRSEGRGRCGQSSAATTSASVGAMPSGPRPRGGGAFGLAHVLPPGPGSPAAPPVVRRHVRPEVVAHHREGRSRPPLPEVGLQARDPLAKNGRPRACPGSSPDAGREFQGGHVAPASRVIPSGVTHHGFRCIPISSAPPWTSRKATSMFRYDRSSPASPSTTAATSPAGSASASSAVTSAARRTRAGRPRRRGPATAGRDEPSPVWRRWPRALMIGSGRRARSCPTSARASPGASRELVTTRNGIPRSWRLRSASTAPGNGPH